MNRIEFNSTLEILGIDNILTYTMGNYGTHEPVYVVNNMAINFGGSDYAIVRGQIPLQVAKNIYQKYPDNYYDIRILGSSNDCDPDNYATIKNNQAYIEFYHVYTCDGLEILVNELEAYFNQKKINQAQNRNQPRVKVIIKDDKK